MLMWNEKTQNKLIEPFYRITSGMVKPVLITGFRSYLYCIANVAAAKGLFDSIQNAVIPSMVNL